MLPLHLWPTCSSSTSTGGKGMMAEIVDHPALQGLRRQVLATADAHALYAGFGFKPMARPQRWMERHDPGVYQMRGEPF